MTDQHANPRPRRRAQEPRLTVKPLKAAGDGFLLSAARAFQRENIRSAMDLALVLTAAGGVVFYAGDDAALLVDSANFSMAVSTARSQGALA
jgi:hypothetical protein